MDLLPIPGAAQLVPAGVDTGLLRIYDECLKVSCRQVSNVHRTGCARGVASVVVHSTAHDRFVAEDYARLRDLGITTVREGLRWHLIEAQPGQYNFRSVIPFIEAAKQADIEVIWDLFHFGWPDHLDIFDPQWVQSLAALSREFVVLWKRLCGNRAAFIAPINEISAGEIGILNPFARERGTELKKQWCVDFCRQPAAEAIRQGASERTDFGAGTRDHIASDPSRPDDMVSAEGFRLSMFEAWDMLRLSAVYIRNWVATPAALT